MSAGRIWNGTEWVPITDEDHRSDPDAHPDYTTDAEAAAIADAAVATHAGATDPHAGYATDADLTAHAADTTAIHGIADTADLILEGDSRLSDARTPTSHAASHASAGSDAVTLAQSQVTGLTTDLAAKYSPTNKVPVAGLNATGTPGATTFLRGDDTWAVPAGGGGGGGGNAEPFRGAKAYRASGQSIPSATTTEISYDSEAFDTDGIRDPAQPTRLVLNKVGKWLVIGTATFSANSTGVREFGLRLNGVTWLGFHSAQNGGAGYSSGTVSTVVVTSATTDYVEHTAYQTSGAALNLDHNYTSLTVVYLGDSTAAVNTFVGARATKSAAQSIPDATFTLLTWDTETYDTDALHSTSTNPSRFTVPTGKAGKYLLSGSVYYPANTTGIRQLGTYKNGVLYSQTQLPAPASGGISVGHSAIVDLAVGDYVEFYAYQNSGAALDVIASTTLTWASVSRIEPGSGSSARVRKNSTGSDFTRSRLNLIEGSGVQLTLTDDPTNDEVDVTVTATGGSSEIPISAGNFLTLAGAPSVGSATTTGNQVSAWQLDAASTESLTAAVSIPTGWATVAVDLWWSNVAAGAGNVRWDVFLRNQSAAGYVAGTSSVQDVAAPASDTFKTTTFHAAGFAVTPGRLLIVQVARVGAHANDTLPNDAGLVGVTVRKVS